jgi:hypothetical protein
MAFMVDRVASLDRDAIRASVIDRFSARRMADGYEALYARMLGLDADQPQEGRDRHRLVEIPPRPRESTAAGRLEGLPASPEGSDEVLPDPTAATPA